jgi:hypothetical protein
MHAAVALSFPRPGCMATLLVRRLKLISHDLTSRSSISVRKHYSIIPGPETDDSSLRPFENTYLARIGLEYTP